MSQKPLPQPLELSLQMLCRAHALPQQLVRAMVRVESAADQYAWNPEPRYRYLYDVVRRRAFRPLTDAELLSEIPPKDFPYLVGDRDAEWWGQQASWGPLQVIGAVARELGFAHHFPALCDTHLGMDYGVRQISLLQRRWWGAWGWRGVVAAYNAGSPRKAGPVFINQDYVDKVEVAGGFDGLESQHQ